ncbi:hypothetical protein EI94DRAFT_1721685 [Lactarius quietus]|nr:hypothetical protein EI94DRAFT_1721685 [Lactarius quietus]
MLFYKSYLIRRASVYATTVLLLPLCILTVCAWDRLVGFPGIKFKSVLSRTDWRSTFTGVTVVSLHQYSRVSSIYARY